MEQGTVITYIDAKGNAHNALLIDADQRHEGFVSLVYLNGGVAQRMIGVAHESLKVGSLNCWRELTPAHETKHYADGSSATGPGPQPDHSPDGAPEVPQADSPAAPEAPLTS